MKRSSTCIIASLATLMGAACARGQEPTDSPPPFPAQAIPLCREQIDSARQSGLLDLRRANAHGGTVLTVDTWNQLPDDYQQLLAHCTAYILSGSTDAPPGALRFVDEDSGEVLAVLDAGGLRNVRRPPSGS